MLDVSMMPKVVGIGHHWDPGAWLVHFVGCHVDAADKIKTEVVLKF